MVMLGTHHKASVRLIPLKGRAEELLVAGEPFG
jgi:hypothetical protein